MELTDNIEVVEDVPTAFAKLFEDELRASPSDEFSFALSGGSTATPCYRALVDRDIDWSRVVAVFGDERRVPLDHADSNYFQATQALFDHVKPLRAVYPMETAGGADAYEEIVQGLRPLDFVHLGMGDDGHVASLFPGSGSLEEAKRLVIETGDDLHKHPRITLTYPAINEARLVVFTLMGSKKREMFERVRNGEDFPATHVEAGRIIWIVDEEAAG